MSVVCQACNELSKYPIGFWDGEKSSGQIFNCDNQACLIKQENIEKALAIKEEKETNIIENAKNGISMERVKMQRKELRITLHKMAMNLNVSCSDYSNYEQCRKLVPVGMACRINTFLEIQKEGEK